MRNLVAATLFACFASACTGSDEPRPTMCVVTKDGDDFVRRADLLSSDATTLYYATSFTRLAGGHWQGSLYDAETNEQINALITVDDKSCDTLANWGATSTPIVEPAFTAN